MSYVSYFDDPDGLWRFFVRRKPDGAPYLTTDWLPSRAHDWPIPSEGALLGYQTCDDVLDPSGDFALCGCEVFQPWGQFTNSSDGGDIVAVTSDGWAKAPATQDGGHPGQLRYFVGPGLGMPDDGRVGGWLLAGPDAKVKQWTSHIAYNVESWPGPYSPLGPLNQAFTRYVIDEIGVPFMRNGWPAPPRSIECLIVEQYAGVDVTANKLERFWFARGLGKIRWEAWDRTKTGTAGSDAGPISTAPPIAYNDVPYGMVPGNLRDLRMWTNFVDQPRIGLLLRKPFRVSQLGWPTGFQLP